MDVKYLKWPSENPIQTEGIIVATDLTQQWLLPWWWEHYRRFNSLPVAFVDLGMSDDMKEWCEMRGKRIPLPVADIFVASREELDAALIEEMEISCGKDFWSSRSAWFKKPMACLHSPFRQSLWIDLDCQILGNLSPLFQFCHQTIAVAKEVFSEEQSRDTFVFNHHRPSATQAPNPMKIYNSGVIVFEHGTSLIEDWAFHSFAENHLFRGDQDVLNAIIQKQQLKVIELPLIYNWSRLYEKNPNAIVLHWHGPQGKGQILHQIARANLKTLGID